MTAASPRASAIKGVKSRNIIPALGKSGTLRISFFISSEFIVDSIARELSSRLRWSTILAAAGSGKADSGRRCGFGQICEGVLGDVVVAHFEMEVRAGGAAGASNLADLLSACDSRALADEVGLVVRVYRGIVIVVTNDHGVAISVQDAGKDHDAGVGRIDGSAGGSRDVDAFMHRAVADSETRRYDALRHRPLELARGALASVGMHPGRPAPNRGGLIRAGNGQGLADAQIARVADSVRRHQAPNADTVFVRDMVERLAGDDDVSDGLL